MDLGAVKAASRPDLLACVAAAAENTQGLLNDAELLSAAGQHARAYSLAVLAGGEVGKATNLMGLAGVAENLRAQAPGPRVVQWDPPELVRGVVIGVRNLCSSTGGGRV